MGFFNSPTVPDSPPCAGSAQGVLSRKLFLSFQENCDFGVGGFCGKRKWLLTFPNQDSGGGGGVRIWEPETAKPATETGSAGVCAGVFGQGTYRSPLTVLPRQSETGFDGNRNTRIRSWEPGRPVCVRVFGIGNRNKVTARKESPGPLVCALGLDSRPLNSAVSLPPPDTWTWQPGAKPLMVLRIWSFGTAARINNSTLIGIRVGTLA